MVGGLHGFRPGIDWEYTWQGQGHGRARRGKAAQGSWKNLYTLTWDLARAWGKGRGRKRWKVSKPISSSRVHSFECEHFTPNRLVGYFCIRQTSCCIWSKYLPGTVSFYILMVELAKRFWHSVWPTHWGRRPNTLFIVASRLLQIAVIFVFFCFLNFLLVGLWR